MKCIYCGVTTTSAETVEHIALEGLVGERVFNETPENGEPSRPVHLRLENGEVCGLCNGSLSQLDAYLQKQLGFLKVYWNSVGTKRGRPATAIRPGMYAEHRPDGPFIALNDERHPITIEGLKVVQPAQGHQEAVRMRDFQVDGDVASFTLQQPVRINKRFMRGLYKIAFGLLCFRKGAAFVLNDRFEPLRAYIRYGRGSRRMAFTTYAEIGSWEAPRFALRQIPGRSDWIAILRLGSTFYIDLSPHNELYQNVDVSHLRSNNMALWNDAGGGKPVDR